MKKLLVALSFIMLFGLSACFGPEIIVPGSCKKYVVLDALNFDSLRRDPISVLDVQLNGDCLVLTLQYGGGCAEHEVDLALIQPFCGTPPLPPATFDIRHNAHGDACKALINKEYSFDISGIREEGKRSVDFILMARNSEGEITSTTYTYHY